MSIFKPRDALRLATRDDGQSLVEFAVCLPVLLLIVTGIFTFGMAFNQHLLLTDATNVGARLLAVSRGQTLDPCAAVAGAVAGAAPLLHAANLRYALVLNGVSYTGSSCRSSTTSSGSAGNLVQGSNAKLTVTYPCSLAVYGLTLVENCTLTAQTTELVQ